MLSATERGTMSNILLDTDTVDGYKNRIATLERELAEANMLTTELKEEVCDALGCTDGDDIRTHLSHFCTEEQ